MRRLASIGFLLGAVSGPALADAKLSATPCVNRESTQWRQVRDAILDAKSLQYCTGDDCWSLDRVSNVVTLVAKRPAALPRHPDGPGAMTDGNGATLGTVDEKHVEFCPSKGKCKTFKLKFGNPATNGVFVKMNDAHTLGAVLYLPDYENGLSPEVIAFDLVKGKQLAQLAGESIDVLDNGFLVDHETFYSAAFKKVGKLAAPDRAWIKLSSKLIALRDAETGEILIQDTTTAKLRSRIPTGAADHATFFELVPSPDATTLYAIGWAGDEGEVLTIDVATAKITARATPTVCAAGMHRAS